MDFEEGLPIVNGFNSEFVIVDRLCKYVHFIPLKHPFSTKIVAESSLVSHCVFP
ncbi:hypothetical protein Syun_001431 [Stephania yunnanensis]|uniref:Uncharacterized protein n=1 Tax=Stephania yunnanensis TaxID=152371 RepID=A0AAP0LE30_9MAGN